MKRLELSLVILYIALTVADLFTTVYGFSLAGAAEKNPLIDYLAREGWIYIIKMFQIVLCAGFLKYAYDEIEPDYPKVFEIFLGALNIYLGYIVLSNILIIVELA